MFHRIKHVLPIFQSGRADTGSGGAELGLLICKEIVVSHYGVIWV